MEDALKSLIMNGAFVLIILIVIGIEYFYRKKHKKKLENKQYRSWFNQSEEKLSFMRTFYVITSIIVIPIGYFLFTRDIIYPNSLDKDAIGLSFIIIYLGVMGIVSKTLLLKIPFSGRGPIQYLINSSIILYGLYHFWNNVFLV